MTDLIVTLLLIIAGLFLLGSLVLLIRGLRARSQMLISAYGVERQEVRRTMLVSFSRSAILLLVALVLFAIYGITPQKGEGMIEATALPQSTSAPSPEEVGTRATSPPTRKTAETPEPDITVSVTLTDLATQPVIPPGPITDTVRAQSAIVDSFNGLWLRAAPDAESEVLELLLDETPLILLQGREPSGEAEWQQVRAPNGSEGWVFIQFILYQ